MAKSENQSQSDYPPTPSYQDHSVLTAAIKELAAAIAASRAAPAPSTEAIAAGTQYLEIKGALRRYFVEVETARDTGPRKSGKYE
jgi:hypothetical protein